MSRLPSFSRIERVMECLGAAVLPKIDQMSDQAELGKAKHAFFAHPGTREEALEAVSPEFRAACEAMDLDSLGVDRLSGACEVALAWDATTGIGRELWRGKGSFESVGWTEFYGVQDWVAVGLDEVVVIDLKTGRRGATRADRNWQLRSSAVAAAAAYGKSRARVAILHAPDGEDPRWDVATMDEFELALAAEQLRELATRVQKADKAFRFDKVQPRVRAGDHCSYCPAMMGCPAYAIAVKRLAAEPERVVRDLTQLLTPETAARAYGRRKLIGEALKLFDKALYAYAKEHPIPLESGMVFGELETSKEAIDGRIAFEVIMATHGVEVASKAVELETSKAAIDRGMHLVYEARKKAGEKVTLKALNAEALGSIRAAGGAEVKTRSEVSEYRPRLTSGSQVPPPNDNDAPGLEGA